MGAMPSPRGVVDRRLLAAGAGVLLTLVAVNQLGIWRRDNLISSVGQLGMSLMALIGVLLATRGRVRVFATLGMIGCFLGDAAPRLLDGDPGLAMIAAFSLGHLFLVVAFWPYVDWQSPMLRLLIAGLFLTAAVLLTVLVSQARTGSHLLAPMVAYAILLVLMATVASSTLPGLVGGLLFVISDSILALRLLGVVTDSRALSSLLMACYGLALLLLSVALITLSAREEPAARP